jgi:ElaB/YqjD/DUF883 family membrane-anchored ribosome-binding protein
MLLGLKVACAAAGLYVLYALYQWLENKSSVTLQNRDAVVGRASDSLQRAKTLTQDKFSEAVDRTSTARSVARQRVEEVGTGAVSFARSKAQAFRERAEDRLRKREEGQREVDARPRNSQHAHDDDANERTH